MIRDTHSKALLETDVTSLEKYRKEKKKDREFQQLKDDVQAIKVYINRLQETLKKMRLDFE
jgi:hypothetical protein